MDEADIGLNGADTVSQSSKIGLMGSRDISRAQMIKRGKWVRHLHTCLIGNLIPNLM